MTKITAFIGLMKTFRRLGITSSDYHKGVMAVLFQELIVNGRREPNDDKKKDDQEKK